MNIATYLYDYRNVLTKLRKDINNTAYADESGRQIPFSSARGSLQTALQSTLDDLCHFIDEALME